MEDGRLIHAVLNGDRQAYGQLVDKYHRVMIASARQLTRSKEDAEDMAQEAFVEAYRSLPTLRDPQKFKPWLFTILRRQCLRKLRQVRADEVPLDDYQESLAAPRQDNLTLDELVGTLPLQYREVVVARYLYDMQFDEIANLLGITPDAARMRCNRALDRLRTRHREEREEQVAAALITALLAVSVTGSITARVLQEVSTMTHMAQVASLPTVGSAKVLGGIFSGWIIKTALGILLVLGIAGLSVALLPHHAPGPFAAGVVANAMPTPELERTIDGEKAKLIFSGPGHVGESCGASDSDLRFDLIGPGQIRIYQLMTSGRFRVFGTVRVSQTGETCTFGWINKNGQVTANNVPTPADMVATSDTGNPPATTTNYWTNTIDGEPAAQLFSGNGQPGSSCGALASNLHFDLIGPGAIRLYQLKTTGRFRVLSTVRVTQTGQTCTNGWIDKAGQVTANHVPDTP